MKTFMGTVLLTVPALKKIIPYKGEYTIYKEWQMINILFETEEHIPEVMEILTKAGYQVKQWGKSIDCKLSLIIN